MMKEAILTYVVNDGQRHFGFAEIYDGETVEKVYLNSRILIVANITEENIGETYRVALSYAEAMRTGKYPNVLRAEKVTRNNFDELLENLHPVPPEYRAEPQVTLPEEPEEPEVIEETYDAHQLDLEILESSVHGISTAVAGIEVALTPKTKEKVDHFLTQILSCATMIEREIMLNASEEDT